MTYVRGAYNAITPFYKWHTVRPDSDTTYGYHTKCGLFMRNNVKTSTWLDSGDKCDTNACGLKDK